MRAAREEEVFGSFFFFFLYFIFLFFSLTEASQTSSAPDRRCSAIRCRWMEVSWATGMRQSTSSSSITFSCSSSSFLLASSAWAVMKRSAEESTHSPADPAREGRARVGRLSPEGRRTVRTLLCGPAAPPEVESSVPVGRRTRLAPPPPAAPHSTTPLQDQRCGVGLRRGQLRRSAARVATTSAGVVPSGGGHWLCRRQRRAQPSATRPPAWVRTENGLLTTQGNACLCRNAWWWLWWLWF